MSFALKIRDSMSTCFATASREDLKFSVSIYLRVVKKLGKWGLLRWWIECCRTLTILFPPDCVEDIVITLNLIFSFYLKKVE